MSTDCFVNKTNISSIPLPPFQKTFIVAAHLTLANDLRVFLSWTPMKMSTTYRLSSESAEAFVPLKSHLIGIMTML